MDPNIWGALVGHAPTFEKPSEWMMANTLPRWGSNRAGTVSSTLILSPHCHFMEASLLCSWGTPPQSNASAAFCSENIQTLPFVERTRVTHTAMQSRIRPSISKCQNMLQCVGNPRDILRIHYGSPQQKFLELHFPELHCFPKNQFPHQ